MSLTQLLIQVAARGTLLLLLTALAGILFRRASAATRHLIWTGGLAVSLIVPLISVPEPALQVLPTIEMPSADESSAPPSTPSPSPTPGAGHWPALSTTPSTTPSAGEALTSPSADQWSALSIVAGTVWIVGLALVLLRFVAGSIAISRLARRAVAVRSPEWLATIRGLKSVHSTRVIRYLESSEVSTPCTWGTLSPTILLPAVGTEWSGEERRQVVVHELAHIRRYDCATQVLTTLALALNWFNPLAWLAQRQSRVAREQACDDAVLAAGGVASTYATLLLTAAAPEGGRWLPAEAQAMARRSQIGDRLLAVLDPARRRNPVTRRSIGWLSTTALAAALPILSIGFRVPRAVEQDSLPRAERGEAISLGKPAELPRYARDGAPSRVTAESPDVCDQSKSGNFNSTSSSYTDDGGDERKNHFTLSWHGPDCTARIDGRGRITFTPFEDDVMSMSDGARFEIETETGKTTRNYLVTNRNGSLARRYQVNEKDATFDDDGLKWRSALILEFIRRSGWDAEARAGRIRKRGGIDALVDEIAQIQSDGARSIYIKVGLADRGNSAADVSRLTSLAGEIGSDGDRASVLKAVPVSFLSNASVQDAYATVAKGIGSDGDKAAVLTSAIRSGKLTAGSCEWVVDLADAIGSDGDRSAVLISATESLEWNSSCVRKSLQAARKIGSDGDKAATLLRFLEKHGLPGDLVPVFFATTATIGSDGDHSQVLIRVINLGSSSDAVVEGLLQDSRRIGSDGDHSSVLIAVARRGLVKTERQKELFLSSAKSIGSDGDREAVMRAYGS